MSALTSRSDVLYGRLLLRLRNLPAGGRLPSVRQLMREYAVSQVTIDRAVGRLKEGGFVESRLGRGIFAMGKRRLGTITLLASEGSGQFDLQAMRVARQELDAAGYDVRVSTFHLDQGILPALAELAGDGLMVLPSSDRRVLLELHQARPSATPTVLLDLVPDELDVNAVGSDNAYGGALAAKHLLELGHRRLALLQVEPEVDSQRARVAGFTRHAELAGAESVEVINCLEQVRGGGIRVSEGSYGVGHFGIRRLLRERGSLGFTAAFVDSDMGALGVMKALHEARIAMPEAISVIGFDDLPVARYFHPALTTIRQDLGGWFRAALRIIEARLAGDAGPAQRIRVRPELVVRESTGPCPDQSL